MELERQREKEPNEDSIYEKHMRDRQNWVDRQMTGKLVIHSRDLEYRETRQGRLKYYLSPTMTDTALDGWAVFEHDIRRQSGRHRHQGGIIIYVIEGEGISEVNGQMLEWKAGDLLLLPIRPGGCAHQHFNKDTSKRCRWIAFRDKLMGNYIANMITQLELSPDFSGQSPVAENTFNGGKSATADWKVEVEYDHLSLVSHPDHLADVNLFDRLIEIRDRQRAQQEKASWLVRGDELPWEWNAHGKMQWYMHPCLAYNVCHTHLFYRQEIAVGSRSGVQRHSGGVIFYILSGEGYTEVDGVKFSWQASDVMTLPLRPDGVTYRHVNSGSQPVVMLAIEPNLVHTLGVDRHGGFEQIQSCPEFIGKK